jgi:uncharacterized protein
MEENEPSVSNRENQNVWKLKGTLFWGTISFSVFAIIQAIAFGMYIGAKYGQLPEDELDEIAINFENNGDALSIAMLATIFICVPILLGMTKFKKNSSLKEYFSLNHVSIKKYLHWIGLTLLLLIASDSLSFLLGRPIVPEVMLKTYASSQYTYLLFFSVVIGAPLFEELFFRGFLFIGFANSVLKPIGAILLTSFLWAVIHIQYDLYGIITIFLVGIFFGIARHKTGSIFVPMLIHALNNLIAMLETAYFSLP